MGGGSKVKYNNIVSPSLPIPMNYTLKPKVVSLPNPWLPIDPKSHFFGHLNLAFSSKTPLNFFSLFSPVFIPHPVFVPERGEKDRIRQEVEQRIVEEERRLEEEERRRKELEELRKIENEARLIQEEERRRQEVEYWRQQVQEEEERRRQEQELRIRQQEEEEVLVPAASSRDARLALGNLVLGEEGLEARKESVELPPRVRMECFRLVLSFFSLYCSRNPFLVEELLHDIFSGSTASPHRQTRAVVEASAKSQITTLRRLSKLLTGRSNFRLGDSLTRKRNRQACRPSTIFPSGAISISFKFPALTICVKS